MIRRLTLFIVTVTCALAGASPAFAQGIEPYSMPAQEPYTTVPSQQSTEQADRVLLKKLARQVKRIDRETAKLMNQAMEEARANDGSANADTKARLLSLRDERDRLFSRMLILSMRYGWEIPDLEAKEEPEPDRAVTEREVFGAIDMLVQRRFAAEAQKIAGFVRLPVVSINEG